MRRESDQLVLVDEAGEAIESDALFRTRALGDALDLRAPDSNAVEGAASEIESIPRNLNTGRFS